MYSNRNISGMVKNAHYIVFSAMVINHNCRPLARFSPEISVFAHFIDSSANAHFFQCRIAERYDEKTLVSIKCPGKVVLASFGAG